MTLSVRNPLGQPPRSGRPTTSPSPCVEGPSGRLRRSVTSLLKRLRPGRRPQAGSAPAPAPPAGPPLLTSSPGPRGSPARPLSRRHAAARAAATFWGVNNEALRNCHGAWRMQLSGLQELNGRDAAVLGALQKECSVLEDIQLETSKQACGTLLCYRRGQRSMTKMIGVTGLWSAGLGPALLTAELAARQHDIDVLQLSLRLVETELGRREAPLAALASERGLVDLPDDATLCLYCVNRPADTAFACCGHAGACTDCASRILEAAPAPHCPHCRRPNPEVHHRNQRGPLADGDAN